MRKLNSQPARARITPAGKPVHACRKNGQSSFSKEITESTAPGRLWGHKPVPSSLDSQQRSIASSCASLRLTIWSRSHERDRHFVQVDHFPSRGLHEQVGQS